jgi:hypothetical protein
MKRHLSILAALVVLAGCHDAAGPGEPAAPPSERPLLSLGTEGDHAFKAEVEACIKKIAHDGESAKQILKDLQDSKKHHKITKGEKRNSTTADNIADRDVPAAGGTGKGTATTISWDPAYKDKYADGTARDPCASLLHEMRHAQQDDKGTNDPREDPATKIRKDEIDACTEENKFRNDQGLPLRTQYGSNKLPDSAILK